MKRGYQVSENDDSCIAVVASSAREAKKIGFAYLKSEYASDCEWTDLEVSWVKGVKVDDLPIGVVEDLMDALKRSLFTWVEEEECPVCNETSTIHNEDGIVGCLDCIEKEQEKSEQKTTGQAVSS